MRVLIIGGGIGGPVAAVALQRAGIESVIYEAHPGPAESQGLFLGLGINGMRVLGELDLLEPLRWADTIPTPLMEFSSTTGRSLGVLSNGWLDEATPSMTLMRGTLQRVLAESAQARGIELRYGMRLVGYDLVGEGVIARFEDGSEVEADLLIGADGIHSRVRGLLSPDAPAPTYAGLLNLGGVVGQSGMSPTPDTMHMVWGRRAFFGYTVRADGRSVVVRQCRAAGGTSAAGPGRGLRGGLEARVAKSLRGGPIVHHRADRRHTRDRGHTDP